MSAIDPRKQLQGFIDKFDTRNRALIRSVRAALRRKFPSANEIVYDNYNFFVIGYGATERSSDCFISIAAASNGVGLCFLYGATLPDPKKILLGSGKQTRFIRLESANVLKRGEVTALLDIAAAKGKAPLPSAGRGKLIIRSISKKQRPRRRGARGR